MSYATIAALREKLSTGVDIEDLSHILDQVEDALDACTDPHIDRLNTTEAFRKAVWQCVEWLAENQPVTSDMGYRAVMAVVR